VKGRRVEVKTEVASKHRGKEVRYRVEAWREDSRVGLGEVEVVKHRLEIGEKKGIGKSEV
jgi:hypothetical protein